MENDAGNIDWVLLARYVTGDLSPAEAQAAERWLDADPRHRAALEEMRAVWAATRGEIDGWDADRAVARLRAQVEAAAREAAPGQTEIGTTKPGRDRSPARVPSQPLHSPRRGAHRNTSPRSTAPRRRQWVALAAGIAAVAAGVWLFRLSSPDDPAPVVAVPTITEVITGRGEHRELLLPDGSRAQLAAASQLRYDSDFGVRHRQVTLEGEAYFEIAEDETQTFEVETSRGIARDIGTAFVVRKYGPAPMQVVVTEGIVVLRPGADTAAARDSLVLEASQLGQVLPTGELVFDGHVNPDSYLAWTRGQLAFDDAPLSDVAVELSRWYDADVRVANGRVGSRRFTGTFARGSVADAVQLVAAVADVSARRSGDAWVFE